MKKDLIIGAITNYDFEKVRPWVKSVNEHFVGDKVMIVLNASFDTVEELLKHDFKVIAFEKDESARQYKRTTNMPIHVERFLHIYNLLKDDYQDYRYIITTDVKDIVFQSNPSDWLEKNLGNKKLIASTECLKYKDESWGNQNFLECFGPFLHDIYKNELIYNVGTLGGDAEYMKDLALNIFQMSLNRPIQIVDQAVFNMMIYTHPYKDVFKYSSMNDGWACQLGTVMDPSKIHEFAPNLTEKPPIFDGTHVLTHDSSKKFCIVHQYDRVPELKQHFESKYA
jgi:hypothetical protein